MVTRAQMRSTVRRMTARYTPAQMQNSQIDTYLNNYYTLFFPKEFKNIKLTKPYVFTTVPNVDTYQFPYQNGLVSTPNGTPIPGNVQISPPVYCQGYILRYYQDKTTFYNRWPKLTVNQQIGIGDNTPGPYAGIIPPFPFLRGQLDIFGNVTEAAVIISAYDNSGYSMTLTDKPVLGSNTGNLVDASNNVVGTVHYLTGVYTFTLVNPGHPSPVIPSTATIYASVVPYQSSRPTDVIFYNQQITFRPVPQQVYQVEFQISQMPMDMVADTDVPELNEWYELICAGASKLIYNDFPDPEGEERTEKTFQEHILLAQRRTLKQLGTQRAATIFSQPGRPLASWFWGTEYSGTSG